MTDRSWQDCGGCMFFVEDEKPGRAGWGTCHHDQPKLINLGAMPEQQNAWVAAWPPTEATGGCGAGRPKAQPRTDGEILTHIMSDIYHG